MLPASRSWPSPGLEGERSPTWLCASQPLAEEKTGGGEAGKCVRVCATSSLPAWHAALGTGDGELGKQITRGACVAHPPWSWKSTGTWGHSSDPALSPHTGHHTVHPPEDSTKAFPGHQQHQQRAQSARVPARARPASLRMKDAVRGSFQPSSPGLCSPPLAFPLAANQAERMGRRGCNRRQSIILVINIIIIIIIILSH